MTRLRLLLGAASVLVALAVPASASAATGCGSEIVSAAVKGGVSGWYSPGCYRRASKLLGSDLRAYGDVPGMIAAAKRRDTLRKLKIAVARKAPASKVAITFNPAVGSIRVSIFARRSGRFVVAAVGTLRGARGTLRAKLGKATRIRVSVSYIGAGDKPVTVFKTLRRG